MVSMNLSAEKKGDGDIENRLWTQWGEGKSGMNGESSIDIYI